MNEIIKFITDLFNFRLWIDSFEYFTFSADQKTVRELNRRFHASFQKTIVLGVLVLASNLAYRQAVDTVSITTSLLPVVISGFAAYLVLFFLLFLYIKQMTVARFYINFIVIHLTILLCVILLLSISGFVDIYIDFLLSTDEVIAARPWFGGFISLSFALCCSFIVSLMGAYNTVNHSRAAPRPIARPFAAVTIFNALVVYGYVMHTLPSGVIQ